MIGPGITAPFGSSWVHHSDTDFRAKRVEGGIGFIDWHKVFPRTYENVHPDAMAFVDQFRDQLANHQLRREIVATQWANDLVNHMGPSYVYRLEE